MCVYDRCADEGRIDLLSAKLFALLFEGRYRSLGDNLFEYGNGSRQRASCISAPSLQYATDSTRCAQSVSAFMTTHGDLPRRDCDGVSESARLILDSKTIGDMGGDTTTWESRKEACADFLLRRTLIRHLQKFPRWRSGPPHELPQVGRLPGARKKAWRCFRMLLLVGSR